MDAPSYPRVLEHLRARCSERDHDRGDAIFRVGDTASAVYYLLRGEVHLLRHGPDGERVTLHRVRDQGFFAEASLGAERYHCTALCMRPSRVLTLPTALLRERLVNDPEFALDWVAGLGAGLRQHRSTVERLRLRGAEARVRHYLLTEGSPPGEVALDFTLSHWADLLGITREALYRTLARMEQRGELRRTNNCLRLMDK